MPIGMVLTTLNVPSTPAMDGRKPTVGRQLLRCKGQERCRVRASRNLPIRGLEAICSSTPVAAVTMTRTLTDGTCVGLTTAPHREIYIGRPFLLSLRNRVFRHGFRHPSFCTARLAQKTV